MLTALIVSTLIVSSNANAERVTAYDPWNYVPHFYEFDTRWGENPNRYYWCGHAALKTVLKYRTGVTYGLTNIHNTLLANNQSSTGLYFKKNCPNSKKEYCAVLEDMVYASNNNYGLYARTHLVSKNIGDLQAKREVFKIIKNAIKQKKLLIAFARTDMKTNSWGHAWVITGYNTDGVSDPYNDPSDTYLFFRDVVQSGPTYPEMDDWYTLDQFYRSLKSNSNSESGFYKIAVF